MIDFNLEHCLQSKSNVNILVVEDNPAECRSLSMALRAEGFFVYQAHNAKEALKILDSQPVDVALVDLMIPEVNGLQLGRLLKDSFPDIKLILVSAYHISKKQILLSGTGAIAFLPKPYDIDNLIFFLNSKIHEVSNCDPVII